MKDVDNPFAYHYDLKVNVYKPLNPEIPSYYQSLIGIMVWMDELVRIDISTEVSMLLAHNTYPREGHFVAALHIIYYLKSKH